METDNGNDIGNDNDNENLSSSELPRHTPDNPYNYTSLQLAERKKALKDMTRDYPDLSFGWLEMAYDFYANTPQEEIKRIISEKLWEGPGKFSDVIH